jgi:salicylate hydroxylase
MKILVAGAGIGGLTAALCLQKAGHDVTVLEKSAKLSEVGAGIQCGANALQVLAYLGLRTALERSAVRPESAQFRDYKTGEVLHTLQFGAQYEARYQQPYLHVLRADLQKTLVEALDTRAPQSLMCKAGVVGYAENEDSVTVTLIDGRTLQGDLLIGADGIKSVVRENLLGVYQPKFTGHVAWRILVPAERLPQNWMDTVVTNFVGPKKHAVLYYVRNRSFANLVGVVENRRWQDESWVVSSPWSALKADFSGWHPTVQAIIDAADQESCYRWALTNHRPFKNWSSKRVTLLGDAAHATLPFMAAGAALAIEDARVLERALSQETCLAEALQLYQRNRQPRSAKIQKMSRQLGAIYHFDNRLMRKAVFQAIRIFAAKNEDFLPAYNANTIELI